MPADPTSLLVNTMNQDVTAASADALGQRLLARDLIDESDLSRALQIQAAQYDLLGQILVRLGSLSEEALLSVLSEQTGYSVIDPATLETEQIEAALEVLGIEREWLQPRGILIWSDDPAKVNVCSDNPLSPELQDEVTFLAGDIAVQWWFCRASRLEAVLERIMRSAMQGFSHEAQQLREMAEDAPVINLVNSLIAQAIDERASDIHIEPGERRATVRYRIDGVMHQRGEIALDRFPAVGSRLKLISGLDIAERRLPQDGRMSLRAAGASMDMRVSVMPSVYGESFVMRLLPRDREEVGLNQLGLAKDHLGQLDKWLKLTSGIILVTGPTGSGKSTTLYAALEHINDQSRKIITVEDPVEHRLDGILQIQVQADIDYTFARALRSILRHDPDVIMIGEIRDRETAEIAMQAALTGHLVLATLHTNDALSAFSRLIDMGIEPYLVAAACQAVMAQRLVRRSCVHCAPNEGSNTANTGCSHCQHTGYSGRVGIYELVTISPDIRDQIARGASLAQITAIADRDGRRSLRQDGLAKAEQGLTTVEEVLRVAALENE